MARKKVSEKSLNLSDLANLSETFEKRLLFMGLLTKELLKYNIKPIVVGGNAVEFYTLGGYATRDIDIVCVDYRKLGDILKDWKFKKKGRHWFNEEYDLLVESPTDRLHGCPEKVAEVRIKGLKVYLIGVEDIIIDRLNAYVHWHSENDGRWAKELLVLNWDKIDWNYLEKQSKKEKTAQALTKLIKEIK
ncbi:MAG: DUF6036 family nucleotidyltransferase [Elusimicrobiota bacterium]